MIPGRQISWLLFWCADPYVPPKGSKSSGGGEVGGGGLPGALAGGDLRRSPISRELRFPFREAELPVLYRTASRGHCGNMSKEAGSGQTQSRKGSSFCRPKPSFYSWANRRLDRRRDWAKVTLLLLGEQRWLFTGWRSPLCSGAASTESAGHRWALQPSAAGPLLPSPSQPLPCSRCIRERI